MISGVIAGIVKEFKLLRSQKIALALVVLYPVIIGLSLGIVYGGGIKQDITIGVIVEESAAAVQSGDSNAGFASIDFISEMQKIESLAVMQYYDRNSLQHDVESGKLKAGVVIFRTEKSGPYKIEALIDNSRVIESMIVRQFVLSAIDRVTTKITLDMLNEIWSGFLKNEQKLQTQQQRIELLGERFKETRSFIKQIRPAINEFDIYELRNSAQKLKLNLAAIETSILETESNAADIRTQLQEISNALLGPYSIKKQVSIAKTDVEGVLSYGLLGELEPPIIGIKNRLIDIENNLGALENMLNRTELLVIDIQTPLPHFKSEIASAKQWAETLDAEPQKIEAGLRKLKEFIDEWQAFDAAVERDIAETKSLIDDLLASMHEIKTYPPEMLASPTRMWFSDIFPHANLFSLLLPASLSIVVLFTTILLTLLSVVSERGQKVYLRLQTSPTSRIAQITAKVSAQVLLAMLECALIAVLAILAFGVVISGTLPDIIVVLSVSALFFVSIGLFLSIFFKNESSAILGCLLLVIPALLVSGVIIPFELMPATLQFVEFINPLSASITMLSGVMVRGRPCIDFLPMILTMLLLSALLILSKFLKKEQ